MPRNIENSGDHEHLRYEVAGREAQFAAFQSPSLFNRQDMLVRRKLANRQAVKNARCQSVAIAAMFDGQLRVLNSAREIGRQTKSLFEAAQFGNPARQPGSFELDSKNKGLSLADRRVHSMVTGLVLRLIRS